MLVVSVGMIEWEEIYDYLKYLTRTFEPVVDFRDVVVCEDEDEYGENGTYHTRVTVNGHLVLSDYEIHHDYRRLDKHSVWHSYLVYPVALLNVNERLTELAFSLCSGSEQLYALRFVRNADEYFNDLSRCAHGMDRLHQLVHDVYESDGLAQVPFVYKMVPFGDRLYGLVERKTLSGIPF